MNDGFYSDHPALASDLGWMMQSNQISDDVLLQALVQEYWGDLIRFSNFYLAREDLAHQAACESLLAAINNRHRYWGENSLKTWMIAQAHKTCKRVEEQNSQTFLQDFRAAQQQRGGADQTLFRPPTVANQLLTALHQLQEPQLFVTFLHYALRFNAAEAASVMKTSPRRAGALLHEARQVFRGYLPQATETISGAVSSPTCQWSRDRLEAWQNGLLKDDENRLVSAHLEGCPECQVVDKNVKASEGQIAESLAEVWPSYLAGEAELSQIVAEVQPRFHQNGRRRHFSLHVKELIFVGLIIALIVAVGVAAQVMAPEEKDARNQTSEGALFQVPVDFFARLKILVTGNEPTSLLHPHSSPAARQPDSSEFLE